MKKSILICIVFLIKVFTASAAPSLACHAFYRYPKGIPRVSSFPHHYQDNPAFFAFMEIKLNLITPLGAHPVPNTDRMSLPKSDFLWIPTNHIANLADSILKNGYNLKFPTQVFLMPDGRRIGFNGHHTREAMVLLGENTIPAVILLWNRLSVSEKQGLKSTFGGEFLKY